MTIRPPYFAAGNPYPWRNDVYTWEVRVLSKGGRLIYRSVFSSREYAEEYILRGMWHRYEVVIIGGL